MRKLIAAIAMASSVAPAPFAFADATQTVYLPKRPGPVAMVISGASPSLYGLYHDFTKALADIGYYAVLLYGNEILRREGGRDALESAIDHARQAAKRFLGRQPWWASRSAAARRSPSLPACLNPCPW